MLGMDREETNAAIAGCIGLAVCAAVLGINNFNLSELGFEDFTLAAVGFYGMYRAVDELVLRKDSLND